MTQGKELPEHMIKTIRRLTREGYSVRNIAKLTGVSTFSVQKYQRIKPVDQSCAEVDDAEQLEDEIDPLETGTSEPSQGSSEAALGGLLDTDDTLGDGDGITDIS